MLLRTRVILLVLLSFALVIAGMLIAGLWNERLVAELRDGDILRGQETIWRELTQARLHILATAMNRITRDAPLAAAVADENRVSLTAVVSGYLTAFEAEGAISRMEILGRDGEVLYNSGNEMFWSAGIGADQRDAVLRRGEAVSGLASNANRRLVALVAAPITVANEPGPTQRTVGAVILSFDVMPNLEAMRQSTGALTLLVNRRGRLIQGTDPLLWEQIRRHPVLSRQREIQMIAVADRVFAVARIPIAGISQSRIADLITIRDVTAAHQRQQTIRLTTLMIIAGASGIILLALFHYLRNAFRPLNEAVAVLDALARGDTLRTMEGVTRADEIGDIAQAVEVFREHMIALDAMKRARDQQRRRQQRFIRREMTRLAETLEPGARAAVLEDLSEIEEESRRAMESVAASENLGLLAGAFGHMATRVREQHRRLDELIRELREALKTKTQYIALQQELDIAREIQLAMLPKTFPACADVEIFGAMIPAKEVGGDFYDFFALDEHRIGVVVADVSGKGVPAALFMAIAKTLLRATALFRTAPGACLSRLNDLLCENNEQDLFVTVFYGVFDRRNGRFCYANGGHNPPLHIRADGSVVPLPLTGGLALAILDRRDYAEATLNLAPGDSLYLYTDGVTEAMDCDGVEFTMQRLIALLHGWNVLPAHDIPQKVIHAVHTFERGAAQADDITSVVLRYTAAAEADARPPLIVTDVST